MTVQTVATVLLSLAAVALIAGRQLRWRTFDTARALRLPLVLGGIGLLALAEHATGAVSPLDAGLLLLELVLSVGVGLGMGRLAVFRPAPDGSGLQTRTGAAGAALWLVLIAVRFGIDAIGEANGSRLLTRTGMILVLVAVSRAVAALVTRAREPQRLPASA